MRLAPRLLLPGAAALLAGGAIVAWLAMETSRADVPAPADFSTVPEAVAAVVRPAIEACRAAPEDPEPMAALGAIYHGNGEHRLAARCYELALERGATGAKVPYRLGLIEEALGHSAAAIDLFGTTIDRAPEYAPAHFHLGRALLDAGRLPEAVAALEQAASIDPDDPEYHAAVGAALRQSGELEAAEAALRRALALAPEHAGSHQLLGLTLQGLGRPEEAGEHLGRGRAGRNRVVSDPWLREVQAHAAALEIMLDIAEDYLGSGRAQSAAGQLERTIAAHPRSARTYRLLGRALLRAGRPQEAIDALVEATDLDPRDPLARSILAGALLDHGLLEGAKHEMEQALAVDPTFPDALVVQAALAVKRGDPGPALEILPGVIERRPDIVAAHIWLGEALLAGGRRAEAADAFAAALELEPAAAWARRRLEEIAAADGTHGS